MDLKRTSGSRRTGDPRGVVEPVEDTSWYRQSTSEKAQMELSNGESPMQSGTKNEACANCGRTIGKLETPRIWDGHVVCAQCDARLRPQTPPQAETPANQPKPPQGLLQECLQEFRRGLHQTAGPQSPPQPSAKTSPVEDIFRRIVDSFRDDAKFSKRLGQKAIVAAVAAVCFLIAAALSRQPSGFAEYMPRYYAIYADGYFEITLYLSAAAAALFLWSRRVLSQIANGSAGSSTSLPQSEASNAPTVLGILSIAFAVIFAPAGVVLGIIGLNVGGTHSSNQKVLLRMGTILATVATVFWILGATINQADLVAQLANAGFPIN